MNKVVEDLKQKFTVNYVRDNSGYVNIDDVFDFIDHYISPICLNRYGRFKTLKERFDESYKVDQNGCWIWQKARSSQGYGQLHMNQRLTPAHRVSLVLNGENLIKGYHVDHLCRVPACVNPAHLEQVLPAENIRRGLQGILGNANYGTHCRHGHEYDQKNTYVRIDGTRRCRTCERINAKRRRHEKTRDNKLT